MHSTLSQLTASSSFCKCGSELPEGSVLVGGHAGHMVWKKGILLTIDL